MIALIYDQSIRTLHVGDSKLVIIGGRGKLKYETIGHNLFEISTDSGLIDYINAEVEVPSNVVTNMIGDSHFRLDLSTKMELAPNDTVLLGSDGLYDNIGMDEICELCKLSSTLEIASAIQARCNERMNNPLPDQVGLSKPDDLSFILFRRS
jgi:serine/threonine protein phosphatase PrpC